jgi:carbonic anhydrase
MYSKALTGMPRFVPAPQQPFAIVLGCSDSRVPVEIVLDQGPGDLFAIRVAGNIVAPSQFGSVEFAASRFGSRLAVVLGHSHCSAVLAALDDLRTPAADRSRGLLSIVDRIRPSVEGLIQSPPPGGHAALVREAVRANVMQSIGQLRTGSEILRHLMRESGLLVVGEEYSVETGVVDIFDGGDLD